MTPHPPQRLKFYKSNYKTYSFLWAFNCSNYILLKRAATYVFKCVWGFPFKKIDFMPDYCAISVKYLVNFNSVIIILSKCIGLKVHERVQVLDSRLFSSCHYMSV